MTFVHGGHGRAHVHVAEQFLNRPDVVAVLSPLGLTINDLQRRAKGFRAALTALKAH